MPDSKSGSMQDSSKDSSRDRPPYTKAPDFKAKYSASCFCGATQWEFSQDPLDAMYCHCETCQTLHGTPYQWAAVCPKDSVHFTKGGKELLFYHSSTKEMTYKLPCKLSCKECHAPVADEGRNMMLMLPPYIHFKRDEQGRKQVTEGFQAKHHMFYGKRVADMNDGLEKFLGRKGDGKCDDKGNPLEEHTGHEDEGHQDRL